MTRILSELFGSAEQSLRASLDKLERASGHPNADIRLTAEVIQASKAKLKELGMDPHDTTGPELYASLQLRLREDDARLAASLQAASNGADVIASVAHALRTA